VLKNDKEDVTKANTEGEHCIAQPSKNKDQDHSTQMWLMLSSDALQNGFPRQPADKNR
jgi:hypothetical protein